MAVDQRLNRMELDRTGYNSALSMFHLTDSLAQAAATCLIESDPARKVECTREVAARWRRGELAASTPSPWQPHETPGRPSRPQLVPARALPKRKLTTARGRASLIHAVAHIEFNAINLAWDAVQRFTEMPDTFRQDWTQVAIEEAEHFVLLRERLQTLGYDYGDLPAHDGLWDMARRTAGDALQRMALVPRVLEARGLDVTPGMIERLRTVGDDETADRLGIILRDEVGHVAVGNRWYRHLCQDRGLDPNSTFTDLIKRHLHGEIRCPLNREARLEAGFAASEIDALEDLCRGG
jgi:uncharacterized ferritin-like protein (DUF455 family)